MEVKEIVEGNRSTNNGVIIRGSSVLSTGNLRKAFLHGIVITTAAELFQLLPIVSATFDILDIMAQVVGVVLASIVSRTFYKHWLTIETH